MSDWITPTSVGSAFLATLATVGTVIKMRVQARITKEAQDEAARLRRDQEERAARHQAEAEERRADHSQTQSLIVSLQKASDDTLGVLKNELASQREASKRAFDILDRNTASTEKIAQAVSAQAQEIRTISGTLSKIEGGLGAR